ncbi:MAG: MFS transporter [Alphaproteobacteria bacterium]|nr:MFS transporter [Alphaproteobacteria bacterium]
MTARAATAAASWRAGLTPKHWRVLWGSYLGWIFDGYETFALVVALPPALRTLLPAEEAAQSGAIYAGLAIGLTLLGWGIGGLAGGVMADYFGRKRMMLWSIFFYALLTGLTAFSTSFTMLIAMRFLTGLALGAEWSTGIALVAESWPDKARPKGLGFLQSGFGMGSFLAAAVWFVLNMSQPMGDDTWRLLFVIGALPGLLVFYLIRALEESERWLQAVREQRWDAVEGENAVGPADGKRPFTLAILFRSKEARRRVWLTFLLSLATTTGWWAISTWLPVYAEQLANAQGFAAGVWGPRIALVYTFGGLIAYVVSGFVADALGRRLYLLLLFAAALGINWLTYLWTGDLWMFSAIAFFNGMITLGFGYSWMAIYPVELFTSTVRSTAASVIFNGARMVAWVFPIIAGNMVANFGGITNAALVISSIYVLGLIVPWFLPETVGKPLPR